ncbi:MAG TPA: GntR family transcriptional regulator [Clostridium sp.]|uniref:GntR family transcriptional regulator n=1 Tax=Clostridium sp. TaxID=1506 RepID=UPI002F925DF0
MINYMDELIKNTNFANNLPIREVVYESLRRTIISGIIPVGERIIEKEYAERLNISRTPVREALRRLEREKLVEHLPKIGVVVKRITTEDVIEIYKIRINLEVLAAINAMEIITPEEIDEIEGLLDLIEVKNKEGKVEEVIELFGEFNWKLYLASGMKRLAVMITKLNEYTQRFRNISISHNSRREKALMEHRQILKAIVDKNEDEIKMVIKKHLEDSIKIVLLAMKDSSEEFEK